MVQLAEQPAQQAEDRSSPRLRTLRGATLVYSDGTITVSCSIRDRSDGGARIQVPPMTILPRRVWLLDHAAPVAFEAEVLWRKDDFVGLKWVAQHDLHAASDPSLRVLWLTWVEKSPR